MTIARWLAVPLLLCFLLPRPAAASWWGAHKLHRVTSQLQGTIVDYTHNHDGDHRLWSNALCQKRDLYVYLPPCFDPNQQYPFMLWLHGFAQDEQSFLYDVAPQLEKAILCGALPPMIVAAPDGSLSGEGHYTSAGSFFVNSDAGRFEDYTMGEVWNFVVQNFPVRTEREAHVLAGVSMGGGAAYNLAIKYRDRIGTVFGIFPPLNTRWLDCHGRYMSNFDPECWGWRTDFSRRFEVVGRFYGVITIRVHRVIGAVYDRKDPDILAKVIRENPAEMITNLDLKDGELAMYVGYGGRDQFNLDAQIQSFLYLARCRGLTITEDFDPRGKHDKATAMKLMPNIIAWLGPRLAPYAPGR